MVTVAAGRKSAFQCGGNILGLRFGAAKCRNPTHAAATISDNFLEFILKMNLKIGLVRPKTMPKQLLNSSKTTSKMPRKWVF